MDVLPLDLTGDGALRAAAVADREVTRMEGVRLDHLAQYLGEVADDWEPPTWQGPGAEQAVRLGGPGTPLIPEFAVCEVATALGLTQPAATSLCADVLDLAYRLRGLTQSVRCGHLTFARARLIARRTRDLSAEQALLVEERLCRLRDTAAGPMALVARVPMSRLRTVVDQAVLTIRGPETEQEASERVSASLYVTVSPAEPGAADLSARLAAADGVRLDRRLDEVAGWLVQIGDARPKAILRAVALGLLADPQLLKALDQMRRGRGDDRGGSPAPLQQEPGGRPPIPDEVDPAAPRQAGGAACAAEPELELNPAPDGPAQPDRLPPTPRRCEPAHLPDTAREPARLPDAGREPDHLPDTAHRPDHLAATSREPDPLPETSHEAEDPAESAHDRVPEHPSSTPHEPERVPESAPDPVPVAAGVAGCPPELMAKFAGLVSTVLYVHLDRASGTWCEERGGVLTPEQAQALVGHANVTVRPVLDVAAPLMYTGYVAPPLLKEQLALMNAGYCTFPYCHRRARAGDVDHQIPYGANGPTASRNTHRPCRKHHRAKDKGRWRVMSPLPGIWVWTSPAGAVYLVTGGTTTQLNGPTSPAGPASPTTAGGTDARSTRVGDRTGGAASSPASAPTGRAADSPASSPASAATGRTASSPTGRTASGPTSRTASGPASGPTGRAADSPVSSPTRRVASNPLGGAIGGANSTQAIQSEQPAGPGADVRSDVKAAWTPPWDPWQDPDPLTLDEHEVTYALINSA